MIETTKKYLLETYARNFVNFKSGKNATVYDENGKDYIDFSSGVGVVSVGHANERVNNAIFEQISKITHISNLYMIEPQAKLAQKIVELSGYDMAVFFGNSGAEANEGAIKIARKYGTRFEKKKYKILTLEHSFHGRTIATVKATGQHKFHSDYFSPYPDGFAFVPQLCDIYDAVDDETVAVMLELIQGEGGVSPFEKGQIQELASFLKSKDILLIVDEVQTGIFRTGEFLASNLYEITPDIVTMAKGLGGGVPIGAVMTNIKNVFSPGDHGSTFGGNYLVTAAALEVLDILDEYKNSGKFDEHILYFDDVLKNFQKTHSDIFEYEIGLGLMRGLKCKDDETLGKIVAKGFENGVLMLKSGRSTLRFLPPLTISKDEINKGFERLENAIK